jgi:hypothetical protein
MIKIVGNEILRGGEKIGYIRENDIFEVGGSKIGYYIGDHIYDYNRRKIGYIDDGYIKYENSNRKISISENKLHVSGGVISDVCRAAIRLLFGD